MLIDDDVLEYVNKSGAEILERCDGQHSVKEIFQELAKEYGIDPEKINSSFSFFLKTGERKGHFSFLKEREESKNLISGSRYEWLPADVTVELTTHCNYSCRYCFHKKERRNELSTEEIMRILDDLYRAGVVRVTLTGGEPLLHPDFMEIFEHSLKFPIINVQTNGSLITEEFTKKLLNYNLKHVAFQISLDSHRSKICNYLSNTPNAFKEATNAIALLSKITKVKVAMVVTPYNLNDVDGCAHLAKKLGASGFRVGFVTPVGRAENKGWELSLDQAKQLSQTLFFTTSQIR